ncbi:MAG TPA: NAD(P)/FAD-dependent oxidoreductase [Allosphingosinicella sp.]|nr:NAD(P)/FAD-dependent oxidoreductase [Allosphingosinicella sp.]
MAATESFDLLVIGAGHNGLTCAYYLARAGYRVCLLERRGIVGGAAVTEEFHPGFRNSAASYAVSLLSRTMIQDMELARHGLEIRIRPMAYFVPLEDGNYFLTGRDEQENLREIARFSAKDAAAWPLYHRRLDALVEVLRATLHKTPPNVGGGLRDMLRGIVLGNAVRKIGIEAQRDLVDLFGKSVGEILDGWFETDVLKGVLGFDAMTGNYASPYTPGTAYVLLHHVFGEVNGVAGAWGHAIGGMGAITQAMAAACTEAGAAIRVDSPVSQVLVDNGKVRGVRLADGVELRSAGVVSSVHPQLLYGRMIPSDKLPPEFVARLRGWKSGSGTFRMNVALSELPNFTCLPSAGPARHHGASILISPSLDYLDQAFADARRHGWARRPAIEMHLPSVIDDSLAPPGKHVASLFCQHFAPELPRGRSWDDEREQAADAIIDTVTRYAPNFRSSILGRMILSPLDLERKFGLVGGDIFHGQLRLDQLFSARPMLGHADYRGPLDGLYMCGSSTHPGGGVTGIPGHNAAAEIIRDLRRGRVRRRRSGG